MRMRKPTSAAVSVYEPFALRRDRHAGLAGSTALPARRDHRRRIARPATGRLHGQGSAVDGRGASADHRRPASSPAPTDWTVIVACAVAVLPAASVTVTVPVTGPGICSESVTVALCCCAARAERPVGARGRRVGPHVGARSPTRCGRRAARTSRGRQGRDRLGHVEDAHLHVGRGRPRDDDVTDAVGRRARRRSHPSASAVGVAHAPARCRGSRPRARHRPSAVAKSRPVESTASDGSPAPPTVAPDSTREARAVRRRPPARRCRLTPGDRRRRRSRPPRRPCCESSAVAGDAPFERSSHRSRRS